MASYPHSGYNAANNTPAAEAMAMDTARDQGMAMNTAIEDYMANDTSAAAMADEDEENNAANFEGGSEMGVSSTALHAMEFDGGHKGHEERDGAQQAQDTPAKKARKSLGLHMCLCSLGSVDLHRNDPGIPIYNLSECSLITRHPNLRPTIMRMLDPVF